MKMTDLLTKEEWAALEQELHQRWKVNACAYGADGLTFTGFKNFANPLCPAIKASPSGIPAICSVAHQNMAAQAKASRDVVIGECDAGMIKICVPVFCKDEFIGIVGGCGRLPEDGEIDTYAVEKATGLPPAEVEALAKQVTVMPAEEAKEMARFLKDKLSGTTC